MTNIYIQKLASLNTNNTTALFTITNNTTFQKQNASPLSPMPIPQSNAEANQLIKVSGNTRQITESWTIVDFGSGQNNATPNSANSGFIAVSSSDSVLPITAFDQDAFLENYILPITLTDVYQLTIADSCTLGSLSGGYYSPTFTNVKYQKQGSITDITTTMSGSNPVTFDATLIFMVGTVVSALELNTPSYPLNFAAAQGSSSGQINLSWTAPTDTAGGLSSTGYYIYRRTGLTSYPSSPTISKSSASTSTTDTGLTTGTTYYYTIYAVNANGQGQPSLEVSAVAK